MTIELLCSAANGLWMASCLHEARRFRRATARVAFEQESVLRRLLHTQADTEFGREHRFSSIRTARDYQQQVPLRTYEDYHPWIERSAAGGSNVLTHEPIQLFEPTSGSTGGSKLVPYTTSLQQEFQRGIRPWIADLFRHHPELMHGQAYWSISPVTTSTARTPGGIPIGFADDASYVGGLQQWLTRAVMVVPRKDRTGDFPSPSMADTTAGSIGIDAFRYATLRALVRSASLRLISIWHPSFLTLLVNRLPEWGDALVRDLQHDRRTAERLRSALRESTAAGRHATLWPRLALISCWAEAHAAPAAARFAALFPHAQIQSKGVIATEGFVSFPLNRYPGSVLSVRSHFFEFTPVDAHGVAANGCPRLAHELDERQHYSVILSTGGGLYRYQLHDVVEVVGHVNECPLIRFVGRSGPVADWFGEKLHEVYVGQVLREALCDCGVSPRFAMLACDAAQPTPAYVLYIEAAQADDLLTRVAAHVEAGLRRSFHYDYARLVGQLGALRVFRAYDAEDAYINVAVRRGQRAGSVKLSALESRGGWSEVFRGGFLAEGSLST